MVPNAILQLRVVIKALVDVIGPAVDPNNRLAAEQLQLSIATLRMLEARLPLVHKCARKELKNAVVLGNALAAITPTVLLEARLLEARHALADPEVEPAELDARRSGVLSAASDVVASTYTTSDRPAITRAVIAASKQQFDLGRAWCLSAGFERDPADLPPLEELLEN